MKKSKIEKRTYIVPALKQIQLDNEISLALESNPPFGPDETMNKAPQYFSVEPYKSNIV
jgi:hypothetical protein